MQDAVTLPRFFVPILCEGPFLPTITAVSPAGDVFELRTYEAEIKETRIYSMLVVLRKDTASIGLLYAYDSSDELAKARMQFILRGTLPSGELVTEAFNTAKNHVN